MKTGIADRLRQRLRNGQPARQPGTETDANLEREVIDDIAAEFTTEELLEFLEADRHPVEADPRFKEDLRERLWRLLEERQSTPPRAPRS